LHGNRPVAATTKVDTARRVLARAWVPRRAARISGHGTLLALPRHPAARSQVARAWPAR